LLSPPLIIEKSHIDEIFGKLAAILRRYFDSRRTHAPSQTGPSASIRFT
jgi:hypothetical protein